jgi:hypothetical protein
LTLTAATVLFYLLILDNPTLANAMLSNRKKRSAIWCEIWHDGSWEQHPRWHSDHKVVEASRYCCGAVRHLGYFNQVRSECSSQGGLHDKSLRWYEFKRCCESRPDANVAVSNQVWLDKMDYDDEKMGRVHHGEWWHD